MRYIPAVLIVIAAMLLAIYFQGSLRQQAEGLPATWAGRLTVVDDESFDEPIRTLAFVQAEQGTYVLYAAKVHDRQVLWSVSSTGGVALLKLD